jgi:hypothetical protein
MTLSGVAVRINANGLLHIPNLAHPPTKGVRVQAVEALKKTSSKMLMPAFAMRQRGQDLPLDGRKKSPVPVGPGFTATSGTMYRDNRDCPPSRGKNVCAMHTLDIRYCGMGVARQGGNSALEVPSAPKQAGRRLVFGGGNSPNQDTWQKNTSVLRMPCKYDAMARVPPNGGLHLGKRFMPCTHTCHTHKCCHLLFRGGP